MKQLNLSDKRDATNHSFKSRIALPVNMLLLLVGTVMSVSGLYIQLVYHVGKKAADTALFENLATLHTWAGLIFVPVVMLHLLLHEKWYRAVIKKRLFRKNRVTWLLTLFLLFSVLFGIIPWLISPYNPALHFRFMCIEIHDKTAVVLLLFMIGHALKRKKKLFVRKGKK